GLFPMVGGAFGPPVAGAIFDRTGEYQPAFVISLVLATVALLLSFVLSRLKEGEIPRIKL
ncbi:MAG: MFS transporter, partial [Dehalococcoidia bacterium]|nr:MFS transporter [Dehalococcoidia bacterium]